MAKGKHYSLKYRPATGQREESRLYRRTGTESIEELHALLDKDIIFLSLDLEGSESGQDLPKITEIGISVFDTRDFTSQFDSKDNIKTDVITSRHISVRSRKNIIDKNSRYFLFGKSEHVPGAKMGQVLKSLWQIEDTQMPLSPCEEGCQRMLEKKYRNIVLVLAGGVSDLSIMKRLGIDVQDISTIIAVIDIACIGKAVFFSPTQPSLSWLLDQLGVASEKLHKAGNDAMFSLKVMFRLAIESDWKGSENQIAQLRKVTYDTRRMDEIKEEYRSKMEAHIEEQRAKSKQGGNEEPSEHWDEILEYRLHVVDD